MAQQTEQAGSRGGGGGGSTGPVSRWMQHLMNARMNRKVRRGQGKFMGMDVLILHTVGRRSGQRRETPVSWFPDGDNAWVIVASGGGTKGSRDSDWFLNLMANPDQASIELPGRAAMPVTPHRLQGPDREQAWQRITAAQPRYAKYQSKTTREYPLIRLTPR